MKINTTNTTNITSNFKPTSTDFGIGDPAMVIEILRKRLYSKPIQTLVQEYICNARDACREAGLPQKIVVTVPTPANKVFKVRDYGTGISPDRIANVFVNYCSSTKRTDNKQTGGFGIGAKSAWAYTDSFTVITYYQGVAYHYLAHVAKNNSGSLDLLSEEHTSESNGTEIQIAVKENDLEAFKLAVFRCTLYWEQRPELRGLAPTETPDWYKKPTYFAEIANAKFSPLTLGNETMLVVVDGIPYSVPYSMRENAPIEFNLDVSILVPTGEVEVSADRERLSDDETNRDRIKAILEKYKADYLAQFKVELKACKNLREFIDTCGKYYSITPQLNEYVIGEVTFSDASGEYKFVDGELVTVTKRGDIEAIHKDELTIEYYQLTKTRTDALRVENLGDSRHYRLDQYTFLYEDKPCSKALLSPKIRKYLLSLPEGTKKRQCAVIMATGGFPEREKQVADNLCAIPLSSIEIEKRVPLVKKPADEITAYVFSETQGNVRRSFYCLSTAHEPVKVLLTSNTKKFVYVTKETEPTKFTEQKNKLAELGHLIKATCDNVQLCFISESTVEKIASDPNFLTVSDFWSRLLPELIAPAAKTELADSILYNTVRSVGVSNLRFLDKYIVHDKEFISAYKAVTKLHDAVHGKRTPFANLHDRSEHWQTLFDLFLQSRPDLVAEQKRIEAYGNTLDRYPLLYSIAIYQLEDCMGDVVLYMNAKYKAEYDK